MITSVAGRGEVGVDIGGTFTDVVLRLPGVPLRTMKVPSTPENPARAVLEAVRRMEAEWGVPAHYFARFVHGTTIATNAVIERRGARIGLITTRGFRDVLEIGRQMRQAMYDLVLEPETPGFLVPGRRRLEVAERVSAEGEVLIALDEDEVRRAVVSLADDDVEAIAICFLFSFLRPEHERRVREIVRESRPELMVSLSSEVDPAFREYERTAVTAFDAYLKPVVDRYLGHLENGLAEAGAEAPLQVMQSRGGVAVASVVRRRAIRLSLSGPAAGVIGGRTAARAAGIDNAITLDVGGTSCDIALVSEGKPLVRAEGRIDRYAVRVPMVDVSAIGAGGGSIAWLDGSGSLRVGPDSSGSDPGPACYDRGGDMPTVTDASVVLGYIDPAYFAGGSLPLAPDLASRAITRRLAEPLGIGAEEAALGVHRVVNAQMAEGIRLVSIRQGFDPRQFALVALGGAGPLHATALAADLGIRTVVVPRTPGVLSAQGLLDAPIEHEMANAFPRRLDETDVTEIWRVLKELDRRCAALMAEERVESTSAEVRYFADVCHVGQSHHLEVPLALDAAAPLERLYRDFLAEHDRMYGHSAEAPARIVNLRSIHRAGAPASRADGEATAATAADARAGSRAIRLPGYNERVEAVIYRRTGLGAGASVEGPAIIEQDDTTTLIGPGWRAEVVRGGHLMLHAQDKQDSA